MMMIIKKHMYCQTDRILYSSVLLEFFSCSSKWACSDANVKITFGKCCMASDEKVYLGAQDPRLA